MESILMAFGFYLRETVGSFLIEKGLEKGTAPIWRELKKEFSYQGSYDASIFKMIESIVKKYYKQVDEERWSEVCCAVLIAMSNNSGLTACDLKDSFQEYNRLHPGEIPDVIVNCTNAFCEDIYRAICEDDTFKHILLSTISETASTANYLRKIQDNSISLQNEMRADINEIKATLNLHRGKENNASFKLYYNLIKKRFTSKKTGRISQLIGDESDKESFIESFIIDNGTPKSVFTFLEKWFIKDDFGTLIIYGEPGHGKTTLCYKAIYEFVEGRFLYEKATNVLAVSLNTGGNRELISNESVNLGKALVWSNGSEKHYFSFEDCEGSLLFLDGFDEFITDAIGFLPFLFRGVLGTIMGSSIDLFINIIYQNIFF